MDYLHTRGYTTAEQAFRDALQATSTDKPNAPPSVSADDLAKKIAVYAPKLAKPGENALKDSATVLAELSTMGNPPNIQSLIASIGPIGSEDILSLDPTDKQEGFRELEAWVEGSLDMYKVCRRLVHPFSPALPRSIARIPTDTVPHILSFLPGSDSARFQRSWYVFAATDNTRNMANTRLQP